jgi:hypothetical protein
VDRARGLDGLDGGSFEYRIRIFGRRGVAEFSSRRTRRQGWAVLITAIASSVIGALIFWPHLMGC